MHSLHVGNELPVLVLAFLVLLLQDLNLHFIVLLVLDHLANRVVETLELIGLAELQFLGELLVELILALNEVQLLAELLDLLLVLLTAILSCLQSRLRVLQLLVQVRRRLPEVLLQLSRHLQLILYLCEHPQFLVGLVRLLLVILVELVIMRSQYRNLLEEDLILLGEQMRLVLQLHYDLVRRAAIFALGHQLFAVQDRALHRMVRLLLANSEQLPILNLQLFPQLIILLDHRLAILHLLLELELGIRDLLLQQRDRLLVALDEGPDNVEGELVAEGLVELLLVDAAGLVEGELVVADQVRGVLVRDAEALALFTLEGLALGCFGAELVG